MHQDPSPHQTGKPNRWRVDLGVMAPFSIAIAKLLVHLYASRNYGYFIDELYYLACGDHLEDRFASVTKVATVSHPFSMPSEHFDVFYCRGLKWPLNEIWPTLKTWN